MLAQPAAPAREFPVLGTAADPASDSFRRHDAAHRALVADLRTRLARAALGGPESSRQRHLARGKLLPRQRLEHLLDPGSPFLELSPLAALGMYGDECPAAGIITGVGRVSGRRCVIVANDATVKGGTYYPITVKKHLRAQEVAGRQPAARASTWWIRAGRSCRPRTTCSPTGTTSGASSTTRPTCRPPASPRSRRCSDRARPAGPTCPAMSDEAIIVANQGTIFLGGPPLVKAATGEVVTRRGARRRRPARPAIGRHGPSGRRRPPGPGDGAGHRRHPGPGRPTRPGR